MQNASVSTLILGGLALVLIVLDVVLIALVVAGAYVLYFLITYFISCGHVFCCGAEGGMDERGL